MIFSVKKNLLFGLNTLKSKKILPDLAGFSVKCFKLEKKSYFRDEVSRVLNTLNRKKNPSFEFFFTTSPCVGVENYRLLACLSCCCFLLFKIITPFRQWRWETVSLSGSTLNSCFRSAKPMTKARISAGFRPGRRKTSPLLSPVKFQRCRFDQI